MDEEQREVDCFSYCVIEAFQHIREDELKYAAVYFENAARSLRAINQIRKDEGNAEQVTLTGHVLGGRDTGY